MRWFRYQRIKKLRRAKDEAMSCGNKGRLERLLFDTFDINHIHISYGIVRDYIKIRYRSGYEFTYGGFGVSEALMNTFFGEYIKTIKRNGGIRS
jgi:hypothetical protein